MTLRVVITALAMASGVLHLALDMVLFRGNFGFFRIGEVLLLIALVAQLWNVLKTRGASAPAL